MRLVQITHPTEKRRVALVDEPVLRFLREDVRSCYELFSKIIESGKQPGAVIKTLLTDREVEYDGVYNGDSQWKLLPAFDHPENPHACLLTGTGLTHKASAKNRNAMHEKVEKAATGGGKGSGDDGLTDSMKVYLWGEERGKPGEGAIGVQPEWFYKGTGSALRGHNDSLDVPSYGDDGGEEPEIAGIYLIDKEGAPVRVGFAIGNEFSDHVMEKKNYLYLAPSKLRSPAIGPELVLTDDFNDLSGEVSVSRKGETLWSQAIKSGEENMAHSLYNLEYHHFKYEQHRLPGMVHIHFFGTGAFSYGVGIRLEDGDEMKVSFDGFGRPLINSIHIDDNAEQPVKIRSFNQS